MLTKDTDVKQSIKIHRCVFNTVVVWLHILGPYWCLYVVLFSSSNTVVVWLHKLGLYWCLYVALFGSSNTVVVWLYILGPY